MILIHQDNVAGFAGAHTTYWVGQPLFLHRIAVTSAVVVIPALTVFTSTVSMLKSETRTVSSLIKDTSTVSI